MSPLDTIQLKFIDQGFGAGSNTNPVNRPGEVILAAVYQEAGHTHASVRSSIIELAARLGQVGYTTERDYTQHREGAVSTHITMLNPTTRAMAGVSPLDDNTGLTAALREVQAKRNAYRAFEIRSR